MPVTSHVSPAQRSRSLHSASTCKRLCRLLCWVFPILKHAPSAKLPKPSYAILHMSLNFWPRVSLYLFRIYYNSSKTFLAKCSFHFCSQHQCCETSSSSVIFQQNWPKSWQVQIQPLQYQVYQVTSDNIWQYQMKLHNKTTEKIHFHLLQQSLLFKLWGPNVLPVPTTTRPDGAPNGHWRRWRARGGGVMVESWFLCALTSTTFLFGTPP